MASLMCKVILSFVFVWSSIRINASTVKNDFVELPNGVMEITLQYLDIKEYFRVTLQTKQLYRTFYPPLPILVYHHYHQWFTDPQFSIRHPQDIRNLSRYSVFLQSVLLRERSTFKYGMLLQVFTNTLRFERSGDNPNPAADYFSLHRDAFEYGVYRGHEVTIYHSTSVALPVVYDPFTSRLHLYASPSAPDPSQIASTMRLSLPAGFIFTDTYKERFQTESLTDWQCTLISRFRQKNIRTLWIHRINPFRLMRMLFDAEGFLYQIRICFREYPYTMYSFSFFQKNKYRLTSTEETVMYTSIGAFYDPTASKTLQMSKIKY